MELKAKKRKIKGSKVKRLRKEQIVPAVIFSKGKESINIKVPAPELKKIFSSAGETDVIDLKLDKGKTHPVLISEVQRHHITGNITHVGFHEIDLSKKVRVDVPVNYVGTEEHPLIKNNKAILIPIIEEVEVEALPKNLPRSFEVSIEKLEEIEDVLTVKDLKKEVDTSKVELLIEDEDAAIAKLDYAEMLEIEEEEEKDVSDVEITTEAEDEEGEGDGETEAGETQESGKSSDQARGGPEQPEASQPPEKQPQS